MPVCLPPDDTLTQGVITGSSAADWINYLMHLYESSLQTALILEWSPAAPKWQMWQLSNVPYKLNTLTTGWRDNGQMFFNALHGKAGWGLGSFYGMFKAVYSWHCRMYVWRAVVGFFPPSRAPGLALPAPPSGAPLSFLHGGCWRLDFRAARNMAWIFTSGEKRLFKLLTELRWTQLFWLCSFLSVNRVPSEIIEVQPYLNVYSDSLAAGFAPPPRRGGFDNTLFVLAFVFNVMLFPFLNNTMC